MSSVFSMVKQVLADSKEKIAAAQPSGNDGGGERKVGELPSGGEPTPEIDGEKVAQALDYLANNIHLVVDQRSPQEKIAEHAAISEALAKQAMGDESQGPHQTKKAPEAFQSPTSPTLDAGQPGAGPNQIKSEGNTQGDGSILEGGDSGQATSEKVTPMSVTPGQSAFPGDAAGNALETTQEESDRPGGKEKAPEKIAQMRAQKLVQLVKEGKLNEKIAAAMISRDRAKLAALPAGFQQNAAQVVAAQDPAKPGAEKPSGESLKKKAAEAGVPAIMAQALINKFAADAENPAQISAGQKPELQTAKGADNPAQSQGHEVGESTPDTKGSDKGREALQSVTAAINATKDDLKGKRTRTEMSTHLAEPAFSKAHDSVLQKSLENASSAGVKIAATKAMLQKWASESPERKEQLQAAISKVKQAQGELAGGAAPAEELPPEAVPGEAQPLSVPPPEGGAEVGPGEGAEPVSDAALAAAAQGVTPEDLEMAEAMLQEQMAAAEGGGMEGEMPPGAGMPPEAGAPPGAAGPPDTQGAPPAEPAPPAA